MPYLFKDFSISNINKDGTVIQGPTAISATALAGPYNIFAIGNRIRMQVDIEATAAENFTGKLCRINLGLFTIGLSAFESPSANNFGFQSAGVLPAVQAAGINLSINNNPDAANFSAEFLLVDATNATIVIDFYITVDINRYGGIAPNPRDRFLLNILNNINTLRNNGASAYSILKNIGLVGRIFDYIGTDQNVLDPNTSAPYFEIPVNVRWYNSDVAGVTTNMRYLRDLEISSPSQIAASLPLLTDATATAAQAAGAPIDPTFTVVNNQLSANEDNSVEIILRGRAFSGTPNPPVTDIRVLLVRTDLGYGSVDFMDSLQASEAIIPQGVVISTVLDGALATPSDWVEDVPAADDITLSFVIDGTQLVFGGRYRIIVNVYDSANEDYVTAHISPELIVNYLSPAIPTITGFLSTYNKEYTGNDLTIAPHQRIKASIEVDKTVYNAALAALGFTQTFDDCLSGIICKLENTTGVVNQVLAYVPPVVITPNMSVITDTAALLRLESIFRISEEYAGGSTYIDWTLSFNQPVGTGGTELVQIGFRQKLTVDVFENDNMTPNLLFVRFYDIDTYPTIKTEVNDICDKQQIICEVEKDPTFTGSINFIATIYPATETGDTNPQQIEEEEDWAPTIIQMSQAVSGKLDNVDAAFGGDDFAAFRINVPQLVVGQRYWVTGIAIQQIPDYCPIGLVALSSTTTQRSLTALPAWYVTGNPTAVIAEILAHPDYVGGTINIVQNNVTDAAGTQVGLFTTYAGDIVTATAIDQSIGTAYYRFIVDADFDPGTGAHTIRHELEISVPVPAANIPPIVTVSNVYECTDLG